MQSFLHVYCYRALNESACNCMYVYTMPPEPHQIEGTFYYLLNEPQASSIHAWSSCIRKKEGMRVYHASLRPI